MKRSRLFLHTKKRIHTISNRVFLFAVFFLTTISFIFSNAFAAAGVPKVINFQGRLLDASGNLLGGTGGTNYCFRFSLYDATTSGTQLWPASTPSTMTIPVRQGVFDANIGDTGAGGDALTYNFQDSDSAYVNVEVAAQVAGSCSGVSFETLTPRQRVTSSAYAINSGTVGGYTPAQSATGSQIPVLTSGKIILGDTAPAIQATGATAFTIQGNGATGNIQFFSNANTLDSSGNFLLAGGLTAGGITSSGAIVFSTAPSTSAGSYDILTRNSSTGAVEKIASSTLQTALTFSTGLTNTTGTITANLSTGVSGGQSVIGGTGSGENLTLNSTSNATKGFIIFGSNSAYDETNARFGIGTITPVSVFNVVDTSTATPRGIIDDQINNGTQGARITMRKARGVLGALVAINSGDVLGSWTAAGYDGSNYIDSAKVIATSTGTIGTGIIPSQLQFQTMNASGTLTTGVTLDSSQQVTLANIPALATTAGLFLASNGGIISSRTPSQVANDIGAVTGTGSATQLAYWNGANTITGNSNLYFDSVNGNLGVGTSTPSATGSFASNNTANILVSSFNNTVSGGSQIVVERARGTATSYLPVLSGDRIGFLGFIGEDGTGNANFTSSIETTADENFTSTKHGAHMSFYTDPIGSITRVERLRITAGGFIGIGGTAPGAELTILGNQSSNAWGTGGIAFSIPGGATYTDTTSSGTVSNVALSSYGLSSIAASTTTTYTTAETLYISGAPTAGANATIGNAYGLFIGTGGARIGGGLTLSGSISAPAWSTAGINEQHQAATYTDTTSSGTVATVTTANSFGTPTFAASTTTTYTSAANVYIAGAPTAGTNVTIANPYALYIASGQASFLGGLNTGLGTVSNLFTAGSSGGVSSSTISSLLFGGASTVNFRVGFNGNTNTTIAANNSSSNVIIGSSPIATPATTSTSALIANLVVNPVGTITIGAGSSVTNTASLYINGESSGTVTGGNYAALINSGTFATAGNISAGAWGVNGINEQHQAATYTDTTSSGTVANTTVINSFAVPVIAASSTTTYTTAANVYIAGAPTPGTNATITNSYALYVSGGNTFFGGSEYLGGATPSASINPVFDISSARTGINTNTNGVHLLVSGNTYTDNSTAASSTTGWAVQSSFGSPVFAATNSSVTYGNAATIYIAGAPTPGTNATITNSYALYVNSGNASFGGSLFANGGIAMSTSTTGNLFIPTSTAVGATQAGSQYLFGGASAVQFRTAFYGATSSVLSANSSYTGIVVASAPVTAAASGTHALLANLVVNPIGTVTNPSSTSITNTATLYVNGNTSATVTGQNYAFWADAGTNTASSGSQTFAAITPTYAQSGTAGYSAFLVSPFENTTGSGNRYLINAGTSSAASGGGTFTQRFAVTSAGSAGINTAPASAALAIGGNRSFTAWGLAGTALQTQAATYTDTSSSGTVGTVTVANSFGIPTLAASTTTTYTTAANVYIAGNVAAGTNVTITNPYALYVAGYSGFANGFTTNPVGGNNTGANFFTAQGTGINPATTTASPLLFAGATSVMYRAGMNGSGVATLGANTSYSNLIIGSATLTAASSGTHALLANLVVNPIGTVTNPSSTSITNTATLYVNGASTSTVVTGANYAIWSASGTNLFSGNTGIGATPTNRLSVVGATGDTTVMNISTTGGNVCSFTTTTGTFSCVSDVRMKHDIVSLDNDEALTMLNTLNPVTFRYNWQDENAAPIPGFIAQEFEKTFPDMVNTDPVTGYKSLSYAPLVPYIVKGIQDLSLKISVLPTETDATFTARLTDFLKNIAEKGDAIIQSVHAHDVHTQQLCVGDSDSEVCVTKDQLQQLIQNSNQTATVQNVAPSSDDTTDSSSTDSSDTSPINSSDTAITSDASTSSVVAPAPDSSTTSPDQSVQTVDTTPLPVPTPALTPDSGTGDTPSITTDTSGQ